jgi:hypothetical protein
MFGWVLSAPIVHDPQPVMEAMVISPVDPPTAANIIRALAR